MDSTSSEQYGKTLLSRYGYPLPRPSPAKRERGDKRESGGEGVKMYARLETIFISYLFNPCP